jgi:hypothetical protein
MSTGFSPLQTHQSMFTRTYHFQFNFNPLAWLKEPHYSQLAARLAEDQSLLEFRGLHAWQARHQWQLSLPCGVFANDYRSEVTWLREHAARDALFDQIRPWWFRQRDIVERDGVVYYRRNVLERVRDYHENPAMIYALLAFWEAAERDRTLIVPPKPRRPYVTPEARLERFGVPCRGPGWTKDEDAVLYRWFGRRTAGPNAGHHVPLTDAEWNIVLDSLGRRRTRASVTQRLVVLNERLRREFVENGWLRNGVATIDNAELWMSRVLGERPRRLRTRRNPRSRSLSL